jgi:hypothetical protein
MKTWMIRHQNLTFTRPIPEAELIEKIESGQVLPTDEIASNSGFWFSISEIVEVTRHFGDKIRLQSMIPAGDAETTSSTNTAFIEEKSKRHLISHIHSLHTVQVKAKPQPAPKVEKDTNDLQSRVIFGCILITIFCGTLWALWAGSQ